MNLHPNIKVNILTHARQDDFDNAEVIEDNIPDLINDATVIGDSTHPDMAVMLAKNMTFMTGDLYDQGDRRNTQSGQWKRNETTWLSILAADWSPLTTHPVSKMKQGPSVVLGETIEGNRNAESVKSLGAVVLDIDSGPTVDSVIETLESKGIFGIVYTSFNHNKTRVELKHDDVVRKLKLDDTPHRLQVIEYLKSHHKDRYDDEFLQGIEIEDARHHGPKGMHIILKTPPLHKFRVVLPLWEPVELSSLGTTAAQWKDAWADIVTGICVNTLGVSFDSTSCDVNRLIYTARHPKDGDWKADVVQGRAIRVEEVEPYSKAAYLKNREPFDPFTVAGTGGNGDERPPQCHTPNGMVLNAWHTKAKERFLITDLIMAEAGDRIRREASDGKLEIECPFEHEHSTEGGTGTLAMSPHVNEHGVWSVSCPHDACQGRHKLAHLEEMLKAGWFPEECLTDDEYLLCGDDDKPASVPAKEVKEGLSALDMDSSQADIEAAIRAIVKTRLDEVTLARLKNEISEKTPLTKPQASKVIAEIAAQYTAKNDDENSSTGHRFYDKGGFMYKKDGDKGDIKLCQTFEVLGRSSGQSGDSGAGIIILFKNENGVTVEKTLDKSVLVGGNGSEIISDLADAGFVFAPMVEQGTRYAFIEMMQSIQTDKHITVTSVPGWQRDRSGIVTGYLCNTGSLIPVSDMSPQIRLHSTGMIKDREPLGTLEGWQNAANAALQSPENVHWALSLAAGFTGPVMGLIGSDSCGFNLSGDSSKGKTIAGSLAASVWASPIAGRGNLQTANATQNALEDLAVKGSESVMVLDEIGAMQNIKGLSSSLFGLGSGTGKSRKKGNGAGLADNATFQAFVILTNEHGLKTTITSAGGTYKTGLSTRFPDIDVSLGVKVAKEIIADLELVKKNFGHAGPLFVQHLIDAGWINRADELKARVSETVTAIAGTHAAEAATRAARVFALIQVSGELAVEAGILSDANAIREAVAKAYKTFKASDEGKVTEGASSMLDGLCSFLNKEIGKSIIHGNEAGEPHHSNVLGWYDDDWFVLDWVQISNLKALNLNGTRSALTNALKEKGAIGMSGKNAEHNNLPAFIYTDGKKERKVKNLRIKRSVLEV
jgi:hypothetical protein